MAYHSKEVYHIKDGGSIIPIISTVDGIPYCLHDVMRMICVNFDVITKQCNYQSNPAVIIFIAFTTK